MISLQAALQEVRRRKLRAANYVPHRPYPKQAEFLALDCEEALYGGAAGSGKSDALLMAAAQYIHVPGYAAKIFRRTYKDLSEPDAIMARAQEWWCGLREIHWDAKLYKFTFPSGATISFGYLDTERDKDNYQGAAFQFIAFDEVTQFPNAWYLYLFSRLRKPVGMNVPLRMRATGNPGGIGHDWVWRRFVKADTAIAPFIPARLEDNPALGKDYENSLKKLDPITYKQLREGVWIRDGIGLVYACFDEKRNTIAKAPKCQYYVCAWDFGVVDQNAFCVAGWNDNDPTVYIAECARLTGLVDDVAAEHQRLENEYHFIKVVGDIGGMGKLFAEELAKRYGICIEAADKVNKLGFIRLLNSALSLGRVRVGPDCGDLIGEWLELPWHESRLKEADGFNNHAADATLYVWRACVAYHEVALADKPKPGSREALEAEERELEARLTAPREEEFE